MNLEVDWDRLENVGVRFEDFVSCDELATTKTLTDSGILGTVNQNIEDNNIDDNDPTDYEPSISDR